MENLSVNHALGRKSCTINSYVINRMVEKEMLRVRQNNTIKQENFIEQKLQENPISKEKYKDGYFEPLCFNNNDNESKDIAADGKESEKEQNCTLFEPQRNEICHYAHDNMKMRRTRTKYRHQYMQYRLKESYEMLTNLQDCISKSEAKLIAQGLPREILSFLRRQYGVDKAVQVVYTGSIQRTIKREKN